MADRQAMPDDNDLLPFRISRKTGASASDI